MDRTNAAAPADDLCVDDRVMVDPQIGKGTIVAWIDRDAIDGSLDHSEDMLLVHLDEDLWAWRGSSGTTFGPQAVAYLRLIAVSISNVEPF